MLWLPLGFLCAASAIAGDQNYVGFSLLRGHATFDRSLGHLLAGPAAFDLTGSRSAAVGFRAYGGHVISPHVALEFGIASSGHFKTQLATATSAVSVTTKVAAIDTEILLRQPLTERLSLLALAGAAMTTTTSTIQPAGGVALPVRKSGLRAGLQLGAGFQYAISDSVAIRVTLDSYGQAGRDQGRDPTGASSYSPLQFGFVVVL